MIDKPTSARPPDFIFVRSASMMHDATEAECERCGNYAAGRRVWMFYNRSTWMWGRVVQRQFFCLRCIRTMRVYAVVGFTLLGLVVGGIVGVTIWLTYHGAASAP